MRFSLTIGDVVNTLKSVPDNTFHGVLTDPPYGLRFMNHRWDYEVPSSAVWTEILRVCRPGAAMFSFGGPRTWHRMAVAIEDAGWEMRDQIAYLYGKGFPKSLNVSKALDKGHKRPVVGTRKLTGNAAVSLKDKGGTYGVQVGTVAAKEVEVTAPATFEAGLWNGYGTALKPGFEPVILARKPLDGTVAQNVLKWGCGALNIDGSRNGTEVSTINRFDNGAKPWGQAAGCEYTPVETTGRWPSNVVLDEDAAASLDADVGPRLSRRVPANTAHGTVLPLTARSAGGYDELGGASRFFYTAKVSTREREAGCEFLPKRSAGNVTGREDDSDGLNSPRAGAGRTSGAHNHHPTLKPLSICGYLGGLIRPPLGGKLLVPFCGAGSEMIGAGWDEVHGIELNPDYELIARARIRHWHPGAEEIFLPW